MAAAQKVKNAWEDLPGAARAGVYGGFLLLTLFGGVALGDGSVPQGEDPRIDANTRANARQDTALSRLSTSVDSLRTGRAEDRSILVYLKCVTERPLEACKSEFIEQQMHR